MPKIDVYNMEGKKVSDVELNDNVFGIEPNEAIVCVSRATTGEKACASAQASANAAKTGATARSHVFGRVKASHAPSLPG